MLIAIRRIGVRRILDIRQSVKGPGRWSQGSMYDQCEKTGMHYRRERNWTPKESCADRTSLSESESFGWKLLEYHDEAMARTRELELLANAIKSGPPTALLCEAAEPLVCHRSVIAGLLGRNLEWKVEHLRGDLEG
jgi:uncharacterized protein (DUF488 family)